MRLAPGTCLGPYEVIAPAGAGGMGEVYKARDTRLDRIVALKVMPPHVAGDPTLRERFEREARAISQLNHPHICVLHDIGRHDGIDFLVMEHLEGETLAARLGRGPMPVAHALQAAVQMAGALDRAHRAGIVHRDLKPSNVMLTRDGVKLLDFGLAKAGAAVAAAAEATASPTVAAALTGQGAILGTLQYMAPEQLEGREVDARADIFAFGAVLHEMLTGKRAFEGKSQPGVIAALLSSDPPPVSSLQPLAPPALDHLVARALAKDPAERWTSMHDVLLQLRWIAVAPPARPDARAETPAWRWERRRWLALSAALLIVAVAAVGWGRFRASPAAPAAAVHFEVGPPAGATFISAGFAAILLAPVMSHDGSKIVFGAVGGDGVRRLWQRRLDGLEAQMLPGTDGAGFPFWAADDRAIAFFNAGKLNRLDLAGGSARPICDAPGGLGGTWNRQGTIVFAPTGEGPLYSVPASGGTPVPVTVLDASRGHISHRLPQFLPAGRRFLYLARGAKPEQSAVLVGSLDSKESRHVVLSDSRAVYAWPGWLAFARDTALFAQRFDLDRLEVTGEAVAILPALEPDPGTGLGGFSFSNNGILAYRGSERGRLSLTWFDRSGRLLSTVGEPGQYTVPRLSPDERKLAVALGGDIWVRDLVRGTFSRVTTVPGNCCPVWSPDGTRLAYRKGARDIAMKAVSGTGAETVLLSNGAENIPSDWSRDGRHIVYQTRRGTRADAMLLPLAGDRTPTPVLQSDFNEEQPRLSPDGRWIAYTSDESGRPEVYVQSLPSLAEKWQISTNGGGDPQWRRDGTELFFIAADRKLMAVPIRPGPTFDPGIPTPLFETRVTGLTDVRTHYQVSADGRRFLVNTVPETEAATSAPVRVIVNWPATLPQ